MSHRVFPTTSTSSIRDENVWAKLFASFKYCHQTLIQRKIDVCNKRKSCIVLSIAFLNNLNQKFWFLEIPFAILILETCSGFHYLFFTIPSSFFFFEVYDLKSPTRMKGPPLENPASPIPWPGCSFPLFVSSCFARACGSTQCWRPSRRSMDSGGSPETRATCVLSRAALRFLHHLPPFFSNGTVKWRTRSRTSTHRWLLQKFRYPPYAREVLHFFFSFFLLSCPNKFLPSIFLRYPFPPHPLATYPSSKTVAALLLLFWNERQSLDCLPFLFSSLNQKNLYPHFWEWCADSISSQKWSEKMT